MELTHFIDWHPNKTKIQQALSDLKHLEKLTKTQIMETCKTLGFCHNNISNAKLRIQALYLSKMMQCTYSLYHPATIQLVCKNSWLNALDQLIYEIDQNNFKCKADWFFYPEKIPIDTGDCSHEKKSLLNVLKATIELYNILWSISKKKNGTDVGYNYLLVGLCSQYDEKEEIVNVLMNLLVRLKHSIHPECPLTAT